MICALRFSPRLRRFECMVKQQYLCAQWWRVLVLLLLTVVAEVKLEVLERM